MSAENNSQKEEFKLIVRIFSTDISGKKSIVLGLCKIRGIDKIFSNAVLKVTGIPQTKLVGDLNETEVKKIEEVIKSPENFNIPKFLYNRQLDPETATDMHIVGNDLKLQNDFDIRRMRRIRSYKGLRHSWGLKVRGQKLKSFRKGGAAVAKKKVKLK